MAEQRLKQIEKLYHAARERETEQRAAFLAEACRGDAELRSEVESLLAPEDGLIDPSVIEPAQASLVPGVQLGHTRTGPSIPDLCGAALHEAGVL